MHDVPFDVLAAIAALIYALNLFLDNVSGKQWASAEKQLKTWIVGVAVAVVGAHIQWTSGWSVGGTSWHQLDLLSQIFFGMTGAGVANTAFHLGQRLDPSGSGDTPTVGLVSRFLDKGASGDAGKPK